MHLGEGEMIASGGGGDDCIWERGEMIASGRGGDDCIWGRGR